MNSVTEREKLCSPIIIAGAGIAGLTTALALADRGFSVLILEKTIELSEAGAGLQLSPNATRILREYGILDRLKNTAITPDAVCLMNGKTAKSILRLEVALQAENRWKAPYLVCHRADLQSALLQAVNDNPHITLRLGVTVLSHHISAQGVAIRVDSHNRVEDYHGRLLVGCDGVWSTLRSSVKKLKSAKFSGHIAWRATLPTDRIPSSFFEAVKSASSVSAWLGAGAHMVAYPVQSGKRYNFVAITPKPSSASVSASKQTKSWSESGDVKHLHHVFRKWHPAIKSTLTAIPQWTFWPIYEMADPEFVINQRLVLLGDAAHAMTPFAAQGAAMAIEDAACLAAHLVPSSRDWTSNLVGFEQLRRQRIANVAKRGALNRFAYHAFGPLAFGRDMLFRLRKPDDFLADLDWLYSYDLCNKNLSLTA